MSNTLEVVVTARPSWARVKSLVLGYAEFFGHESIKVTLAGSSISRNYGDISSQVPEGVRCQLLHTLQDSDDFPSVSLSASNLSSALSRSWASERPDKILVIADRTETLGVSSAAAISQIPLIHLQGGEISGSIDNKIRDANSKLADLHLTTNEQSKERLENIGESSHLIHVVGCPSLDLVRKVAESKEYHNIQDMPGVGVQIPKSQDFGIVMFHPDTLNEEENIAWLNIILDLVSNSDIYWFWFWPNPDHGSISISKELRRKRELGLLEKVRFVINVPPEVFISIALQARVIVGNSSFGIREASFLGLPALNLGRRQRNRQMGSNVKSIVNVNEAIGLKNFLVGIQRLEFGIDVTYGDGFSGNRAAQIIGNWDGKLKV